MEPEIEKIFGRFGTSVKNIGSVLETVKSTKCSCCQVFLKDKKISSFESEELKTFCVENEKSCYIHCPYETNMASLDINNRNRSHISTVNHLKQALDFPCSCVVHIGTGTLQNLSEEINKMNVPVGKFEKNRCPLLLEVAAGQGKSLGRSAEEMRKLFEMLESPSGRIGICLDTQHLFASGECDFSSHESVVKLFDSMENAGTIGMVHLNDSFVPFGKRVDRHEAIGQGYIWSKDMTSLTSFVSICSEKQIDTVMETFIDPDSLILLNTLYSKV